VSSFFAGLKPPVCKTLASFSFFLFFRSRRRLKPLVSIVPNQLVVGPLCRSSRNWHGCRPVPVRISPRRLRRPVRHQHQPAMGRDLDQAAAAGRLARVLCRALRNVFKP
jgi:hypothetical protein